MVKVTRRPTAGIFLCVATVLLWLTLAFSGCSLHARKDTWTAFLPADSDLIGFKDAQGRIKIEPRYSGFTIARKFDHIMAVMEQKEDSYDSYYLTRSGKKVGRDSIYVHDNSPDCESEGFIRFRDPATEKVGLYDRNGEIAIPAAYDALTQVRNGLVVGLQGARKAYWDKQQHADCNHFTWEGGREVLLDTSNRILIVDFKGGARLDLFSVDIGPKPAPNDTRRIYLASDGRYYAFIDFNQEFENWLQTDLLTALTVVALANNTYHAIFFWKEPEGWKRAASRAFIERNFELIHDRLAALLKSDTDYFISMSGLNPFIFKGDEFDPYFNNCGDPKLWQSPVMNVVINRQIDGRAFQDHFDFLKTNAGYKLISLTIRAAELN